MIKHGCHVPAPRTRYAAGPTGSGTAENRTESRHAASLHDQRQVQYAASQSRVKHFANPREDFSTLRGWDIGGPALVPCEWRTVGAWPGRRDLQVRWSYAVAQVTHRLQHVVGDGRHESLRVHPSHFSDRWTIYCPLDELEDMGARPSMPSPRCTPRSKFPCGRRKLGEVV